MSNWLIEWENVCLGQCLNKKKKECKKGDCGNADRCVGKKKSKVALCISIFNPLFYLSESALMRPHAWVPTEQSWQKADVGKKKKKKKKSSCPSPDSVSSWLSSSPLCHSERLIRTCHRSNEYHLNCFVYGSEFGCGFNLCIYSSCGAWRGRPAGRRAAVPNEKPALVTGRQGPTPIRRLQTAILSQGAWQTHARAHTHTPAHTWMQMVKEDMTDAEKHKCNCKVTFSPCDSALLSLSGRIQDASIKTNKKNI